MLEFNDEFSGCAWRSAAHRRSSGSTKPADHVAGVRCSGRAATPSRTSDRPAAGPGRRSVRWRTWFRARCRPYRYPVRLRPANPFLPGCSLWTLHPRTNIFRLRLRAGQRQSQQQSPWPQAWIVWRLQVPPQALSAWKLWAARPQPGYWLRGVRRPAVLCLPAPEPERQETPDSPVVNCCPQSQCSAKQSFGRLTQERYRQLQSSAFLSAVCWSPAFQEPPRNLKVRAWAPMNCSPAHFELCSAAQPTELPHTYEAVHASASRLRLFRQE
jgi:hypothetical protein